MDGQAETRAIPLLGWRAVEHPVVIGLGANLGQPQAALRSAVRAIVHLAPLGAVSSLYRSAPIGPEQPDFLNAALLVSWERSVGELLIELQRIENEAGRVRAQRWGPRVLDLDILWAGSRTISSSSLTVPHPELKHRAFALGPLLEVYPTALDPRNQAPYDTVLRGLSEQRCERVEGEVWWEAVSSL